LKRIETWTIQPLLFRIKKTKLRKRKRKSFLKKQNLLCSTYSNKNPIKNKNQFLRLTKMLNLKTPFFKNLQKLQLNYLNKKISQIKSQKFILSKSRLKSNQNYLKQLKNRPSQNKSQLYFQRKMITKRKIKNLKRLQVPIFFFKMERKTILFLILYQLKNSQAIFSQNWIKNKKLLFSHPLQQNLLIYLVQFNR